MAFFDDMINGIRGFFGGDNKPQAQKNSMNVAKSTTGVFNNATQNANPLDEEEKRRREAERVAAEEARRREEEERKAREEEERKKAEEERKRQVEAERQKRVEQYKAMASRGEFNAQNEYNRQFETLRKEKLKKIEEGNGWFNNAFDGGGKQREELAKNQAHNDLVKKMYDEGMIDYASGDKKVQELVADRGGRGYFNYDFFENVEKNFSNKQRAFDTGKELYNNQSMKKLNGKTASELIDSYNSLSGDDQAEIREYLQKLQYKYTQNDEADKAATVAQFFGLFNKDQNSFIDQKDTSIARQIGKTATSGGFVGDLAKTPENIIAQGAEMFGNKNAKKQTRISQYNHDIDNSNTGGVGVVNKGFEAAANIGLNATGVGKAKILVDQVGGWIGAIDKAEAEKVLGYDENGKPINRNKNFNEKLGTYGGQTLNTVLAGLNLKGIGPNMNSLDGLDKTGIVKELGKYYAKEIPYAAGTGYLNANLQHMANGGKFGEADIGKIAGEVFQDVVLDTGMDLRGSIANKSHSVSLKDLHHDVRNVLTKKTPEGNVNISKLHSDQMGFNKDELIGKFTGDTRKRMSDRAFKVLQEQRVNNPYSAEGQNIVLSNRGNKEIVSTKVGSDPEFIAKMRSTPRIKDIIENSTYTHSADDTKLHGIAPDGFDYREIKTQYGGNKYDNILNVGKNNAQNRNTLYGITTKENTSTPGFEENLSTKSYADVYTSNIAQNNGEVKYKGIVKGLKTENQPTNVKEILSNKQFENIPMADDKIMTKGNLYEQVKIGSAKGDWWSKPQRDGDWEYQLHHRKTKDGKKFSQFERRYVGDGGVGEWQPYSRALYMWKTQNNKIDAANDQEIIQDAIATAREDGQIKDFVYRQNHKQEWETVPLTGKVTLDGGFVRDPKSGEIIGNHIQVTPFGVVNQIGGKYRVAETDNLVSVDSKRSGVTDTFMRKIEKLMGDEGQEYMKGLVDEKRQRYSKFAEELGSFNNEHFELAKRIDKDFRPKNTKEKEFWEDVGRLSENTLQVKGLSGEDAFRSKYGENALIGAKEYTEYMRSNYDRWIKEANEIRRMLGKDEIEYRKNYMPHIEKEKGFFGKMASSVGIKGDLEGESRGEIPAKIAGLTANFSPNKKFNTNEQQRTGAMKNYELDPRKVAEQYADLILYNKHMEPLINRGRSVEASMRALDASRNEGLFQDPDSKLKDGGVVDGVHTVAVKDWVDELAGKSSSIDRPLIDRTNRSIQIVRKLENINGANKIMGNISSTFAQALNLPETIRQNGLKNTGKAILDAFNPEARKAMENSPFLKERYVDTGGKFTKTTSQKVSDKVSTWTGMNLVEGAFIRLNWGANYNRLKSKYSGNELIVQTDRATAKTVGARGIGDMPQAYRSALGKIFLQFTYENNESFKNNIEHTKNIVKNLKTGKKAEAGKMAFHSAESYVTAMALNALYGAVTGNKPLPEPITEFAGMIADNLDKDEKNDKDAGNFAAKGLEQLGKANPIIGAGLNMLPKDDRKNIFGSESDFGRFDGATGVAQTASNAIKGGINLLGGNIDDATTNLAGLIPMGSQIKKTVGGVSTMVKGEHTKTDKNGKEQTVYKIDNSNPLKWAQAALFGRNALSETQDYYAGKDQKKQTPSAENTDSLNELSMKFAEERRARLKDDENYKNSAAKLIDDMAIKIGKGKVIMDDENGLLRDSKTGKIETDYYKDLTKALRKEGSEGRDVYKDYLNSYEGRELEYSEFKKEYDEKVTSGEYSKKQQIKEKQKLDRLEAQKDWEKEYRDAYSLVENSGDIKEYYSLYQTDEERAIVRSKLNAINDRMLEKDLISQKTYNSRYKNINGVETGSKSGGGRKSSGEGTFTAPNLPNFKVGSAPKIKSATTAGRGIVKGLKVDSSKAQISVNSLPKAKISIK